MNFNFIKATLKKQARYINIVKRDYEAFAFNLWFSWLKCYVLYGATPSDWFHNRMYALSSLGRRDIITRRKMLKLDRILNPKKYADIFNHKELFNKVYSDVVHRDWLFTGKASVEDIEAFVLKYKRIVVKPVDLSSGRGIHLFDVNKDNLNILLDEIAGQQYLLEEVVRNHPDLESLNPASCQTIRVYSTVTQSGEPKILATLLRVGGGDSICDNFHAKGVVYPIDMNTGLVCGYGKDILLNEYARHPSTDMIMLGFSIPRWEEAKAFILQAIAKNKDARFVAWDLAITSNGFEMIEGNYVPHCGLMQIFDWRGKYGMMKQYL